MSIPTTAEELAEVCEALRKCRYSQEYYVGPRKQQMARYAELAADRDRLWAKLQAENEGGQMATLGVIVGADQ